MPLISVVVPVYNVEKYLRKCLDSILNQSFEEFELLLINDGSTDRSGEICEEYAAVDNRIVCVNQENRGLGGARNKGIEIARGKYILFIDSDDYIDKNMLKQLFGNIEMSKADVASCGIYNVYQQKCIPQYDKIERFLCPSEQAFGLLLVGAKIPGSSCNKLFRSDIFKNIRFPEGVLYEDVAFHTELMQKIKNVYVDTTPLYYYVHREESITTRAFDSAAMMFIHAYEENLRVVEEKYPDILTEARFKLFWAYFSIFDRILQEKEYWKIAEYKKVKMYLKRNVIRIIKNPYFYKARKIGALALFLNVRLYRGLIRINDRKNKSIFS